MLGRLFFVMYKGQRIDSIKGGLSNRPKNKIILILGLLTFMCSVGLGLFRSKCINLETIVHSFYYEKIQQLRANLNSN